MRCCYMKNHTFWKASHLFLLYRLVFSTYICSTCRDQLPDLYSLVQHVQTAHNIRIYVEDAPNPIIDAVHKNNNNNQTENNSGFTEWLASEYLTDSHRHRTQILLYIRIIFFKIYHLGRRRAALAEVSLPERKI